MALNREQSIELGFVIEERRAALLKEIRDDLARARADAGELAEPASDAGDLSVADLIADLDKAEIERDVNELRAMEAARERLADGRYGECITCGEDIDYRRLRATPSAMRCIDCQRRFEKTHAGPGGPTL